jgi:glycosyltransferase involved in cell wall biosynthesis
LSGNTLSVMQLLPALEAGGVERGTVEVANALVAAGHHSSVISAGGALVGEMPGTNHIALGIGQKSLLTLRHVRAVREIFRQTRPDIVHARSRLPAWIGWLAWKGLPPAQRPRFVTTAHGLYSVSRYSAIMARGERVIAVSDAIRQYLLQSYPQHIDESRIRLIFRGIDPGRYHREYRPDPAWIEAWNAQYPHLAERCVLVLPARITRLKGHLDFIEVIAALRARGVDAHGLMVGGEDPRRRAYAGEVRRKVQEMDLDSHIDFTGHRRDLREILSVSDLCVSMSNRPESFGRTVLEALSLGRPVVGYAHGGVAEILRAMYPVGAVTLGDLAGIVESAHASLIAPGAIMDAPQFDIAHMLALTLAVYDELAGSTRA